MLRIWLRNWLVPEMAQYGQTMATSGGSYLSDDADLYTSTMSHTFHITAAQLRTLCQLDETWELGEVNPTVLMNPKKVANFGQQHVVVGASITMRKTVPGPVRAIELLGGVNASDSPQA